MTDNQVSAREREADRILADALELADDEVPGFVDRACAGDAELRALVAELLAACGGPDTLLRTAGATEADRALAPGERVGAWRVVREIGRGGMGVVYLVERADGQFEQRGALKVLQGPTGAVAMARLARERQILASLEHPGIARLIDGGVLPGAGPYLVLEYVEGLPLLSECDRRRLSLEARLDLFDQACRAVQHAHRNLVVHRDLKPSNMLVAEDGTLKLLDFGIAKVLREEADEAALTRAGAQPLTLAYAAPEQLRGELATTATDVYSLGVVLYELLAGSRPPPASPSADPRAEAPEAEPMAAVVARPTTGARTHTAIARKAAAEAIAAARATTPERLRRALRGDLEAIVRQALQAEPSRRYGSVEAMAEDLHRHRAGQPVRARPATLRYRTGRFVRRHRVGIAAAALVLLSLVGGLGAALWQAGEARRQADRAREASRQAIAEAARARREAARTEKIADFLKTMILEANPLARSGSEPLTLLEVVERGAGNVESQLTGEPALQAQMMTFFGDLALTLDDLERAAPRIERAHAIATRATGVDPVTVADAEGSLGQLRFLQQRVPEAETAFRSGLARLERALRKEPDDRRALATSGTLSGLLAQTLWLQDRVPAAIEQEERALAIHTRLSGAESPDVAIDLTNLAMFQDRAGRLADAERSFRRSLDLHRKLFGARDVRLHFVAVGLGGVVYELGRLEEAYRFYDEALAAAKRGGDATQSGVGRALSGLVQVRAAQGRFAEAEARLAEWEASAAVGTSPVAQAYVDSARGELLARQGRPADALASYRRARRVMAANGRGEGIDDLMIAVKLERLRTASAPAAAAAELATLVEKVRAKAPSPGHEVTVVQALGEALVAAGRRDEGVATLREAVALGERTVGTERLETARADLALGLALVDGPTTAAEGRRRLAGAVRRLDALGRGWWAEVARARRIVARR